MYRCKLDETNFPIYLDACALPHKVEVAIDLLTNDGETIVSFDADRAGGREVTVTDGSVAVDASTLVGRMLSLTVADPARELIVSQDANYTDRMLRASVGVHVAELSKVIWAPVFTGPIFAAPRSGDVVQFTAHGKARFGLHGIKEIYVIKAGTPKTTAIKMILHDLCGEPYSNMGDIPDLTPKLSKQLVLHIKTKPWLVCRSLATSMMRHLTYDGPGQPRMQRLDLTVPVFEFLSAKLGPGVLLSPPPIVSTQWTHIRNAVKVVGGSTDSSPAPIGYAYLDPSDPFSAEKMGRDGAPAYEWLVLYVPTAHTQERVDQIALVNLRRAQVGNRAFKFESIPMYVFDELDLVEAHTSEMTGQTYLDKFTVPLNLNGSPTQSYGFNKRVSEHAFAAAA